MQQLDLNIPDSKWIRTKIIKPIVPVMPHEFKDYGICKAHRCRPLGQRVVRWLETISECEVCGVAYAKACTEYSDE